MEYYSRKTFFVIVGFYIIAILMVLKYWAGIFLFACWMARSLEECISLEIKENIFNGILPMLFVTLSLLIILLQQKGYKWMGYFIIPTIIISPIFLRFIIHYPIWFNFNWFFLDFSIPGMPIYRYFLSAVEIFTLALLSLIPFYVLGKTIVYDLKNKKSAG